jgi:hypothetical protein
MFEIRNKNHPPLDDFFVRRLDLLERRDRVRLERRLEGRDDLERRFGILFLSCNTLVCNRVKTDRGYTRHTSI